jgi:hypothetical protein
MLFHRLQYGRRRIIINKGNATIRRYGNANNLAFRLYRKRLKQGHDIRFGRGRVNVFDH